MGKKRPGDITNRSKALENRYRALSAPTPGVSVVRALRRRGGGRYLHFGALGAADPRPEMAPWTKSSRGPLLSTL